MAVTYLKSKGLHYFPVECDNVDLDFIESKHGTLAYGIVLRLLERIYKVNGYYTEFDEKSMYLFMRMRNVGSVDLLNEILDTCFKENIFCKKMYDKYQILTSESIQKQWQKIVKDAGRKNIEIEEKFNLIEKQPVFDKKSGVIDQKNPRFDTKEKEKEKLKVKKRESVCVEKEPHTHNFSNSFFEKNQFLENSAEEPQDASSSIEQSVEKKEKNSAQKEKKIAVRESVWLKKDEVEKLQAQLSAPDYDYLLDYLNSYKQSTGKKYLSDYAAIQSWGIRALNEHKAKTAHLAAQKPAETRVQTIFSNYNNYIQKRQQVFA